LDEVLRQIVKQVVDAVDPDKIILFGSRSRGCVDPESDYDLLVIKSGITNRRAVAHEIYKALIDIPAAVDILVETPESVERCRSTPGLVYQEAVQGLVVYER
jgi:predicted nucleotidyltransferase